MPDNLPNTNTLHAHMGKSPVMSTSRAKPRNIHISEKCCARRRRYVYTTAPNPLGVWLESHTPPPFLASNRNRDGDGGGEPGAPAERHDDATTWRARTQGAEPRSANELQHVIGTIAQIA